jgi:cell division protein FtsB
MTDGSPGAGAAPPPQRERRRGRHVVRALLLFLVAVVGIEAVVGDRGLVFVLRARRQYELLVHERDRLTAENARLRAEAKRLRDDPGAIEGIARRELGLILPGEKAFIIKDVPSPEPARP